MGCLPAFSSGFLRISLAHPLPSCPSSEVDHAVLGVFSGRTTQSISCPCGDFHHGRWEKSMEQVQKRSCSAEKIMLCFYGIHRVDVSLGFVRNREINNHNQES